MTLIGKVCFYFTLEINGFKNKKASISESLCVAKAFWRRFEPPSAPVRRGVADINPVLKDN